MDKTLANKIARRRRALLVVAGAALMMSLSITACRKSVTEPTEAETIMESTEDPFSLGGIPIVVPSASETVPETVAVAATLAEDEDAKIGLTADGEAVYDFGKYGPLGKEVYDSLANSWVTWVFETEDEIREVVHTLFGGLPNEDELYQEIIMMERDVRETQPAQQETPKETQQVAQAKPAPKETQPVAQAKPAPKETQAPQPTPEQAAPEQAAPEQAAPEQAAYTEPVPTDIPPEVQKMIDAGNKMQTEDYVSGCGTPGHGDWGYTDPRVAMQ